MSDIDVTDSAYLSGNESEIGSVYSDLVPAQDVDQYIANLQQEEAGRRELAEAGYESPAPELDQSIGAEVDGTKNPYYLVKENSCFLFQQQQQQPLYIGIGGKDKHNQWAESKRGEWEGGKGVKGK